MFTCQVSRRYGKEALLTEWPAPFFSTSHGAHSLAFHSDLAIGAKVAIRAIFQPAYPCKTATRNIVCTMTSCNSVVIAMSHEKVVDEKPLCIP